MQSDIGDETGVAPTPGAVKKQLREEERKLNERRAELVGRCMIQKFSSGPEVKETILQDLDGFLSKREDRELFGLPPK